jgi:fatty-acyl-CoA synthase
MTDGKSALPPKRERDSDAWIRALELTASIPNNPERTLFEAIRLQAMVRPEAPAILSLDESFSYSELVDRSNRYLRWALAQGLGRGDTVCLLMSNRPEYMAVWLGITATGCSVALLNTRLVGKSLEHSIRVAAASQIIVAVEHLDALVGALAHSELSITIWTHGDTPSRFQNIEKELQVLSGGHLDRAKHSTVGNAPVTISDRALCIYTSGTTGLPKAVNVSHGRIMQWSLWFAGLSQASSTDKLYNCLPMYHSVGGIVATGPLLISGGAVVIRDEFSARGFWTDIGRWDCTMFQYIGELCRYLLQTEVVPEESNHRIRMCIGNGLRPDIWHDFKARFRIAHILEFYAATEGSVSLFNVEDEPGSLGRIPGYLAHRFPIDLIKWNYGADEPFRGAEGFCIRCAPSEVGEAIGRIPAQPAAAANAFEGYTSEEATAKKILKNVFETGDAWFRTGDLMRRDKRGHFYFIDRIGDTFRWKGENVSTLEVENVICSFPGIRQASVYGVSVPHTDGRAGMAAIASDQEFSLTGFYEHLGRHLPDFAQPLFLRLCREIATTGTFRNVKEGLLQEGYDPAVVRDAVYFRDRRANAFVRLDGALFDCIQSNRIIV